MELRSLHPTPHRFDASRCSHPLTLNPKTWPAHSAFGGTIGKCRAGLACGRLARGGRRTSSIVLWDLGVRTFAPLVCASYFFIIGSRNV